MQLVPSQTPGPNGARRYHEYTLVAEGNPHFQVGEGGSVIAAHATLLRTGNLYVMTVSPSSISRRMSCHASSFTCSRAESRHPRPCHGSQLPSLMNLIPR
jgi:hypothetical protein